MKRGQMEIFGLVIIVLLFSLGILFAIRFVVLKPTNDIRQEFKESQVASNTINAFLHTTADGCKNAKMSDLLADCFSYAPSIDCSFPPDGEPDCEEKINEALNIILPKVLDRQYFFYDFRVYIDEDEPSFIRPGAGNTFSCDIDTLKGIEIDLATGQEIERDFFSIEGKEFKIPSDQGTIVISLKLCS